MNLESHKIIEGQDGTVEIWGTTVAPRREIGIRFKKGKRLQRYTLSTLIKDKDSNELYGTTHGLNLIQKATAELIKIAEKKYEYEFKKL